MSNVFKFVDEVPQSTRGRFPRPKNWRVTYVNRLKKNPGQWALVQKHVYPSSTAAWKKLGCEATARGSKIKVDIYARWPIASDQD